jgi:hypothetical protein
MKSRSATESCASFDIFPKPAGEGELCAGAPRGSIVLFSGGRGHFAVAGRMVAGMRQWKVWDWRAVRGDGRRASEASSIIDGELFNSNFTSQNDYRYVCDML